MFKNYLRTQPLAIQLVIFLAFWSALMLLGLLVQPYYIRAATGLPIRDLAEFVETGIDKYPNVVFGSNALFQVTSFLLPAVIYAYLADPAPVSYLGGRPPGQSIQPLWVILLAVSLIFLLSPLVGWLKQADLGSASRELDEMREKSLQAYLVSGNAFQVVRNVLLIALLPACCEELFFRGLVMKFGYSLFRKWWLSIGISALLFAAFHTSISEFVPIFIAGLVLGWVYYITSSIWMSILLHFLFNGLQVLGSLYSNPDLDRQVAQPGIMIGFFLAGLLMVAAWAYLLRRNRSTLPAGWSVVLPPDDKDGEFPWSFDDREHDA